MGGSKSDPGIFINWSLRLGTTASTCITFDKFWPISRDLVFDIRTLELWVVNEVIMKRKNIPKRDFYSTVVMWNRIGRHKANVKERNNREESRECFHNGDCHFRNDSPNCSPLEVHETERRHFEPSHTSLSGTNNLDDELLIAIKNRLAGVPPMPGAIVNLKQETSREKLNLACQKSNKPQPYVVCSEASKPKKVPTPVATQVDDSMITELKHQGTSTSHVKVTSTFTQSIHQHELGIQAKRMEETTELRHSSSRMNRGDEEYQRSSHLEQNTITYNPHRTPSRMHEIEEQRSLLPRRNSNPPELRHYSSRVNRVDEGFQRSSHLEQNTNMYNPERTPSRMNAMDEQRSLQPRRNSFPNHPRPSAQSQLGAYPANYQRPSQQSQLGAYPANYARPSVQSQLDAYPTGIHSQPRLPDVPVYSTSAERPSVSRSIRSTTDNTSVHRPIGELSRTNTMNTGAMLPYQQQLVNAPNPSQTPQMRFEEPPPPSPARSMAREDPTRQGSRVTMNPSVGRPSIYSNQPSVYSNQHASSPNPFNPPPDGQSVLAMTTQQMTNQMCRCGSKELNLACFCKKSAIKEVSILDECERGCKCAKAQADSCDDASSKKKKKKKKEKPDKEAKEEERRRKKEEKERAKREKKEQKAREKESRKSKSKGKKNKSKKGDKNKAGMCSCCTCRGCEDTTIAVSETSISCLSDDKSKKKSKKEKKPKEKKEKKKKEKKKKVCGEAPFRSCECPPFLQTQPMEPVQPQPMKPAQPPPMEPVNTYGSCRMSIMQDPNTGLVQGCCNHPESPCPALVCREQNLGAGYHSAASLPQAEPSRENCDDPVCPNARRGAKVEFCCCNRGGRVCSVRANVALIEPTMSSGRRSNSPAGTQSSTLHGYSPTRSLSKGSHGYTRDITASPAIILPNEIGRGDALNSLLYPGRSPSDTDNVLINLSERGRENNANKRYVPPCVLYLDCTKVKDLCVIIKDKYEDPS